MEQFTRISSLEEFNRIYISYQAHEYEYQNSRFNRSMKSYPFNVNSFLHRKQGCRVNKRIISLSVTAPSNAINVNQIKSCEPENCATAQCSKRRVPLVIQNEVYIPKDT